MAPMRIVIRSLAGESTEIDIEPTSSINELKHAIQAATKIPIGEQRLVFAGTQLEEAANEAWRKRRAGAGALSAALGVASIPDGEPLTLEHYAIQKGSVVNIVRRIANAAPSDPNAPAAESVLSNAPPPPAASRVATLPQQPDASSSREDPALVEQLSMARAGADRPAAPAPVPVLEFMAPEPLAAPSGGYAGNCNANDRGNPADSEIAKQFSGMSDAAICRLLAPILEQRPRLRAAAVALQLAGASAAAEDPARAPPRAAAAVSASGAAAIAARADAQRAAPPANEPFRTGDPVLVWSNSGQRWCDGEVLRVAKESSGKIPQGAVEVSFELGQKWIAPQDAPRILRAKNG